MTNYKLLVYSLEGCGFSRACVETLDNLKVPYTIINVSQDNKDKFKIPNVIETYPQIYLTKNNRKGTLLLGGYSDLKNVIDTFVYTPSNIMNDATLNQFIKNGWTKKMVLRLIELLALK